MFNVQIQLAENEQIEIENGANHFKGIEGVGGRLFITNQRVVFKSHTLNIQTHELSIPYSEIKEVALRNTMGIIPNGLKIITKSGKLEKFVVWGRKKLKKAIEQKLI